MANGDGKTNIVGPPCVEVKLNKPELGRLVAVNLRDYWAHEALEFTPWLAKPDNIKILGDALGLQLEVEKVEANVGPFRADILCRDPVNNAMVVVENQLETSDHGHLGALLTYAAGLETGTIVWLAPRFTEQHRAALDWLNRVTEEGINFFGVEVGLWRIGDSALAPSFTIVSKPNDWLRTASGKVKGKATGLWADYETYWASFAQFVMAQPGGFTAPKPTARNWIDLRMGFSAVRVTASFAPMVGRTSLYALFRDRAAFDMFHDSPQEVEAKLGAVEWHPETEKGWFSVSQPEPAVPGTGSEASQHQWLFSAAMKLRELLTGSLGAGAAGSPRVVEG